MASRSSTAAESDTAPNTPPCMPIIFSATDRGNHEAALKMIGMQGGVFGAVSDSAAVLDLLATL